MLRVVLGLLVGLPVLLLTSSTSKGTWYAGYLRFTVVPAGGGPARRYLQRVYWDPALERMRPRKRSQYGEQVRAHVGGWPFRRAVVVLDDGTRLWPAGRLRRRCPWEWREEPRPSYGRRRPRPGGGLVAAVVVTVSLGSFALGGPAIGLAAAGVGVAMMHYM
ncbi:hypothetical protein [Nonomuraea sp. NPDC049695]|uniref:hypothetical protein n=1 Tax=Nonomuraea sp. NPDC049695 TaxID=3154734 RepID=UPI00341CF732